VSFAAITLCVASQRVFVHDVYFVIDPVRKLLDAPLYVPVVTKLLTPPSYLHLYLVKY